MKKALVGVKKKKSSLLWSLRENFPAKWGLLSLKPEIIGRGKRKGAVSGGKEREKNFPERTSSSVRREVWEEISIAYCVLKREMVGRGHKKGLGKKKDVRKERKEDGCNVASTGERGEKVAKRVYRVSSPGEKGQKPKKEVKEEIKLGRRKGHRAAPLASKKKDKKKVYQKRKKPPRRRNTCERNQS